MTVKNSLKMEKGLTMSRGGSRAGAGRKAKDGVAKVQLSCKVSPEVLALLRDMATASGCSLGKVIENIVKPLQEE